MNIKINSIFQVKDKYDRYLGIIEIVKITEDHLHAKFSPTDNFDYLRELMSQLENNLIKHGPDSDEATTGADKVRDLDISFHGENENFKCNIIFVSKKNLMTLNISDIQKL